MVYYAYGNDEDYDPLKGAILAENLAELLKEEGYMGRILEAQGPRPSWRFTERGIREPHIEIDGIGGPVAIRKLTTCQMRNRMSWWRKPIRFTER